MQRKFNILHLNTFSTGGAWNATYKLHQCLKKDGHRSIVLVGSPLGSDQDGVISMLDQPRSVPMRIIRKMKRGFEATAKEEKTDPDYYFYNRDETKTNFSAGELLGAAPFRPEVIVVHWVSDFVNAKAAVQLQQITGARMFWYLLDMAPFTGGCHYAWDCQGFESACGSCPGLYSSDQNDRSHKNLIEKLKYVDQADLTIIAPTSRLLNQVTRSSVFKNKSGVVIPIAVDEEIFKPANRETGRIALGLPLQKQVIFVGALHLAERRKGMNYLVEALRELSGRFSDGEKKNVCLLIAGEMTESKEMFSTIDFEKFFVGRLNEDRELALAYQTSDVFVCPSIQDSGPMMINESIMSGTPVVAFEMGVAPDLVISGQTGFLARLRDSSDLAKGIESVLKLSPEEAKRISKMTRDLGLRQLSLHQQAQAFNRLFQGN